MARVVRGLGSLLVLVAGLIGVPVALVVLGGNPLPSSWPGWADLQRALFQRDDGSVLVGLLTVIAWFAWLVFALAVLCEAIDLLTRHRVVLRLPGLAEPQRWAAGLLVSVLAMTTVPAALAAPPPPISAGPVTAPVRSTPAAGAPVAAADPPDGGVPVAAAPSSDEDRANLETVHAVEPGDDLWSLAEHYYGHGRDWRRIAAANPRLLSGGPDRLVPGWRLSIPEYVPAIARAHTVVARHGDTLSSLAERHLGDADRWLELYRLNRHQLDDPDVLPVGVQLVLPGGSDTRSRAEPDRGPEHRRQHESSAVTPTRSTEGRGAAPVGPAATPSIPRPAAEPVDPVPSDPRDTGTPSSDTELPEVRDTDAALALAGVGGLLAAGVLGGLRRRRTLQLRARPVGRRILHPAAAARAVEAELGARQRPLTLRTVDRALRAIGAHSRAHHVPLPPLQLITVADDEIELRMAAPAEHAPVGLAVHGRSWILSPPDAGYLRGVPGIADARPWPTLVTLGEDDQGRLVLADLESLGLLRLSSGTAWDANALLAAMAVELSCSPWAEELTITLVGAADALPEALGTHTVSTTDDLDALLDRLEQRSRAQREHQPQPVLAQHRIDPDLADPWVPEIVLVCRSMTGEQAARLLELTTSMPRVTIAAVVSGAVPDAPWLLADRGSEGVVLQPAGLRLRPQQLQPTALDRVLELVAVTGRSDSAPAPWWSAAEDRPDPPDNVTYLGRRFGGWGTDDAEGGGMATRAVRGELSDRHYADHPFLQIIGPVELAGARGPEPVRAPKQLLEYCAWVLEHPGTSARQMASVMAVAEGTRRSNVSRLRSWLGADEHGDAYLPEAYTGQIRLHPAVTSDWEQLQVLIVGGVDLASTASLHAALDLVRGAPLADAAPGQWHWAEELRTDVISCVRDIGVELAGRALAAGELDRARWAAARALAVAPGDEKLLVARIRTEHLAGNHAETERISLQLAAHARQLGVDLDPETVTLLQEVMEGRIRARRA